MSESPYVEDSEYTLNPSFYKNNRYHYLVNHIEYIMGIDTYSIVNDVVHNGELIGTSKVPHGEYELSIETYVYEPPIPRYPSWTFGQGLWAVLKVAGIVLGCITFIKMVAVAGIIGVLKTVPAAIMDLGEMGWNWFTGATIDIIPRLRTIWPDAYRRLILFLVGEYNPGWTPVSVRLLVDKVYVREWCWTMDRLTNYNVLASILSDGSGV